MRLTSAARLAFTFVALLCSSNHIAVAQVESVIAQKGNSKNAPMDWVSYASRETAFGPVLQVEFDDNTTKSIPAAADSVLIGYLSKNKYGRLPMLSLNLCDSNRFILRFDSIQGDVRNAELVLTATVPTKGMNIQSPPQVFDIELFEVKEAWNESNITWENQPAHHENPVYLGQVDPNAKELRIDATKLVKQMIDSKVSHQGWLVKVASPFKGADWKGAELPPGAGSAMDGQILKLFDWADSIETARKKAQNGRRLVLAVVRMSHSEASPFSEQMLIAATLADPDVRRLISHRLVPVRVPYASRDYLFPTKGRDPLLALGTSIANVRAPALVVSTAHGRFISRWESVGTFDRDAALRFLLEAIAQSGETSDEDGPEGWLLAGELTRAKHAFEKIDGHRATYGLARVASIGGDHSAALWEVHGNGSGSNGRLDHGC
ncbi:MAG: DNRLRE domain-containing protein [Pirellula sp.]